MLGRSRWAASGLSLNASKIRLRSAIVAVLSTAACAQFANAIVLYSGDTPLATHPLDAVVGEFNHNSSAVAIDPDHIVTVMHSGAPSVTDTVTLGGITYKVVNEQQIGSADLRVGTIETLAGGAVTLPMGSYVPLVNSSTPTADLAHVTIGGFGVGAASVINNSTSKGLAWADNSTIGTERWGTNTVDIAATTATATTSVGTFNSTVIGDHFNAEGATSNEAAIGTGDSGGGWFINVGGQWELEALSAYPPTLGQSLYYDTTALSGGSAPYPYYNLAISMMAYSGAVEAAIPEPTSGMLVLTGVMVGALRRRTRRA